MSSEVIGDVWKNSPPNIPIDELCLLVLLADYADTDTRFCWPKVPTLARKLHCGISKTQEMIRALIEKDAIAVYECKGFYSLYYVQDFVKPMAWEPKMTWDGRTYELRKLKYRKKHRKFKEILGIKQRETVASSL